MAQIPDRIKKVLKEYVNTLSNEMKVNSAILFGSYATGNWKADSDIDIAIFSDNFSGIDRTEAMTFLLDRTLEYDLDIQLVNEIVTHGIKIV